MHILILPASPALAFPTTQSSKQSDSETIQIIPKLQDHHPSSRLLYFYPDLQRDRRPLLSSMVVVDRGGSSGLSVGWGLLVLRGGEGI